MSLTTTIQRALILPAFLLLALLVSTCSTVNPLAFADEYGSFDSSGNYNYHNMPSSPRSYFSTPEYAERQHQQERESLQRNQDQLRSYHESTPSVSPYDAGRNELGYRSPSVTILPDGRALTCVGPTRGNPVTTCY